MKLKKFLMIIFLIGIITFINISCGTIGEEQEPMNITSVSNSSNGLTDTESIITIASASDYFNYYQSQLISKFGAGITGLKDCPGTTTFHSTFYNMTNLLYSYTLGKWILYIPKYQEMYQSEHCVGDFFADAMLFHAKTKLFPKTMMFLQNTGGIRMDKFSKLTTPLPDSEYDVDYLADPTQNKHSKNYYLPLNTSFSLEMQYNIAYYTNYNTILKLNAVMLKDVFEHGMSVFPGGFWGSGALLQMSGVKIEIDTSLPGGIGKDRVRKIWLYTDFNDTIVWNYYTKTDKWDTIYNVDNGGWQGNWGDTDYYVGVPNYLAEGGNDYTVLLAAQNKYGIFSQASLAQKYCFAYMISEYKKITNSDTIVFNLKNNLKFK